MKVKFLWTFLAFWALSYISLIAQPTATIVSADTSYCERDTVFLQIKFEGTEPFGISYRVYDINNNLIGGRSLLDQDDLLTEGTGIDNLKNGIWTDKFVVNRYSRIELVEVFDATYPISGNPPSFTPGTGSTFVYGSMIVNIDQMPIPNAGIDADTCGYSYHLKGIPDEMNSNYYWTSTTGSFDDEKKADALFTAESSGIYTLTLNQENGACKAADEIEVDLFGRPKAVISGSKIICSNDSPPSMLNATINLTGNGSFKYDLWDGDKQYIRNLNGEIGDNLLDIQANHAANYTIIKIVDNNQCEAMPADMTGVATVMDKKPFANAGLADDWCQLNDYPLNAELKEGESGTWLTNANLNFANINDPNTTVTSNTYGTQRLEWLVDNDGCTDTSTVDITFVEKPTLDVLTPQTTICEGSIAILKASITSQYPSFVLTYSDGSEETVATNSYEKEILHPESGTYTYNLTKITDSKGCYTEYTNQVFNVEVDFVPNPNPGNDTTICGNSIQLDAKIDESVEMGYWSSEYDGFSNPNTSPNATFSIDETKQAFLEKHILKWIVFNQNNINCIDSATIEVTFDKQPTNVFAGKDTTIYKTDELELNATGLEEGMTGIWSSNNSEIEFNNVYSASTTALSIPQGKSELIWTVSNGVCEDVDSTFTILSRPLTNPNGFSPNGDGINDFFRIGGSDKIENNRFIVFNKIGKVVYKKEGLDEQGWDGRGMDGSILPNGTYYYVFTGDGIEIKDYVILKNTK